MKNFTWRVRMSTTNQGLQTEPEVIAEIATTNDPPELQPTVTEQEDEAIRTYDLSDDTLNDTGYQPIEKVDTVSTMADVSTTETSASDDKDTHANTLSFNPKNNTIIDGDMDLFINTTLKQCHAKLVLSKDINDVTDVFKQLDELLGKSEFIIAVMLSVIQEDKLWEVYGYKSMNMFLDDLPSACKVTRQTINNAIQAGKIIRELSGFLIRYIIGLDSFLTPSSLYRNYSKLKFLYRMKFVWKIGITKEVFINFQNMTFRNFESYMKDVEEQNRELILYNGGKPSKVQGEKPSKKNPQGSRSKPKKNEIPKLSEIKKKICQKVRLGHFIGFVHTSDLACTKSVKRCLEYKSKMDREETNNRYRPASDFFYEEGSELVNILDLDWTEIVPGCLMRSNHNLESFTRKLSPDDIRNVFATKYKNKTELTLAQAYLIYRMRFDTQLAEQLYEYIFQQEIRPSWPLKNLALNVLGIEESRFKWLLRISNSFCYFTSLKGKVNFTSDGFLEKLSYLETAIKKHNFNYKRVADALNILSAKRFREFARNNSYDLADEPINLQDYLLAKPYIDELNAFLAEGKLVYTISLRSEKEQEWLKYINMALGGGYDHIKSFYPGVIWDSKSQVEQATEIIPDDKSDEQNSLVIVPDIFKDTQSLNISIPTEEAA